MQLGDTTRLVAPDWQEKYRLGLMPVQDGLFVSTVWLLGDAPKGNVEGDVPRGVPQKGNQAAKPRRRSSNHRGEAPMARADNQLSHKPSCPPGRPWTQPSSCNGLASQSLVPHGFTTSEQSYAGHITQPDAAVLKSLTLCA